MPEWTLCADLKVYARLRAVAKPATRAATRPEELRRPGGLRVTPVTVAEGNQPRPTRPAAPDVTRSTHAGRHAPVGRVRRSGRRPAGGP
jgi:hypothetical protein